MEPAAALPSGSTVETWRHYMREEIPPLFGLAFNPGAWNQGFIAKEGHLFLLVTLEKGSLNKDHRYEDHFLSADQLQWQSQNKTKQDSKHGQLIHNHREEQVDVHLFVRRHKVLDGKAAPFVYCGGVDFENWEGEQTISVKWKLREPVPDDLRETLNVPDRGSQ
jgi:hypothetical protein